MQARQSQLLLFIENRYETLARTILLFLGSFVTFLFLVNLLRIDLNENHMNIVTQNQYNEATIDSPLQTTILDTEDHSQAELNTNPASISTIQIPEIPYDLVAPNSKLTIAENRTVDIHIGKHERLKPLLKKQGVSEQDIAAINALPLAFLKLSQLQSQHQLTLQWQHQQFQSLKYKLDANQSLVVQRKGNHFEDYIINGNSTEHYRILNGKVHHSTIAGFIAAGLSPAIFYQLQTIFHNTTHLASLPSDTSFRIVLDETSNKRRKNSTHVIAASFITPEHKTYALVANALKPNSSEFYTPSGRSLEKGFLRAPVHYHHISSPFNPHRYHPILHLFRPHYGVDLAASYGTKVAATNDGVISYLGYENGYGNVVKLNHGSKYSSLYGHLGHFASGLHIGEHVKQGDTLGYVGSTGLATGAHLHYEFHVNGKPVDPLKVELPSGKILPKAELSLFRAFAQKVLG